MTKQINLKSDSWCCKITPDKHETFKSTVLKFLNDLDGQETYDGCFAFAQPYYGVNNGKADQHSYPFGQEISLSEFIELAKGENANPYKELDEAAKEYSNIEYNAAHSNRHGLMKGFKAGANWQKEKASTTDKSEPVREEWANDIDITEVCIKFIEENIGRLSEDNDVLCIQEQIRNLKERKGI